MDREIRAGKKIMGKKIEFRFDPDRHEYWLGGKRIPGMTEILKGCGIIRAHYGSELESAISMSRGRAIHRCCELFDHDKLSWKTVSDEIFGYVMAWKKFREETRYNPDLKFRETPMFHPVYLYATIPDCGDGLFKNGERALVEIKTGVKEEWHKLQTAAQELILPKRKNKKRIAIYLANDGTYKTEEHKDPMDNRVFLSLVTEFNWRKAHGYLGT